MIVSARIRSCRAPVEINRYLQRSIAGFLRELIKKANMQSSSGFSCSNYHSVDLSLSRRPRRAQWRARWEDDMRLKCKRTQRGKHKIKCHLCLWDPKKSLKKRKKNYICVFLCLVMLFFQFCSSNFGTITSKLCRSWITGIHNTHVFKPNLPWETLCWLGRQSDVQLSTQRTQVLIFFSLF